MKKTVSAVVVCVLGVTTAGCGKPAAEVPIDNSKMTDEQKQQVEQQGQTLRSMVVPPPPQGGAQNQSTQ